MPEDVLHFNAFKIYEAKLCNLCYQKACQQQLNL